MAVDLGKIAVTPKGNYNSSILYEKLDLVTSQGNSYLSLINDNNDSLTNIDSWQIIAKKGDPGPQGNQGGIGPTGPSGNNGLKGDPGSNAQSFNFKNNVINYADLPATGNTINDAYYNEADQKWYIYNGTSFQPDGKGVNLDTNPDIPLVLKSFLTSPGDVIKKEYTWSDSNQTIYGISSQSGILKKDNTFFSYSESGAEFRTWMNVPTTDFDFIDLNFVRLGGSSTGPYVSMIGKKSDNTIDILIAPNSDPATRLLENIQLSVSDYQSISFTLVNFTSNNAGLNTDFKFIKKGGLLEEDAILKKIDIISNNIVPSLNTVHPIGLVEGNNVSTAIRNSNTNIINNCITTLISRGGGKVLLPSGDYCVNQIVIPDVQTWVNIEIVGEFIPAQRFGTIVVPNLYDPDISLPNGTVLISNSVSAGGVIDCSAGTSYQNFNMGMLTVRNLTVRTYQDPQISGINAYFMFQLLVENVVVDTGIYNVKAIEPTFDRSAIVTPKNSNCALTYINNVSLQGYMHGIKVYEHTNGNSLQIQSCKNALSFYFASHASYFTRCCFQRNTNQVSVFETHVFEIAQLNMEYSGSGQTDPTNAWQSTQYEVNDPNNNGIGNITYANVKGNVGTVNTMRINGASGIIIKKVGSENRITNTIPSP